MHLARGLGVPVVALFTSTPPQQFAPYAAGRVRALAADVACAPCSFYGRATCPRGHAACLTAIGVDEVCAAIEALLAAHATAPPCPNMSTLAGRA